MFKVGFWKDAGERAIRAAAAALAAVLGSGYAGVLDVPWYGALSAAGLAGVLSLVLSLAASKTGDTGTAAFTSERRLRL
jgi:hypothetical protein